MTGCLGSKHAVRHHGAARIAVANNRCVQHISLDLIPERIAAAAFGDGDAVKVHACRTIGVRDFHVVVADGFQNGAPLHELIVVQGHVEEHAAGALEFAGAAGEVGEENHAVAACRHFFGLFRQHAVVARVGSLLANVVLEPAQRQTARTDEAPVKVGVFERAAVKDQARALFGEFRNDAFGGHAEHGAGASHVHALTGFENA